MTALCLATVLSLYEMLWLRMAERHPDVHEKYDLVDERGHRIGAESAEHVADHVLVADLDEDRQSDYALVLVPRPVAGYAVVVLLGKGNPVELIERADGQAAAVVLGAEPVPGRSGRKTLVVTPDTGAPRRFAWHAAEHRFRETTH